MCTSIALSLSLPPIIFVCPCVVIVKYEQRLPSSSLPPSLPPFRPPPFPWGTRRRWKAPDRPALSHALPHSLWASFPRARPSNSGVTSTTPFVLPTCFVLPVQSWLSLSLPLSLSLRVLPLQSLSHSSISCSVIKTFSGVRI